MKAEAIVHVDNARTRVTEWRFAPGAATGHHRHEYDYVVVPLGDGRLSLASADGVAEAALEAGRAYFREAGVEHDVTNVSGRPFAFVEVEFKDGR